MDHPLQLTPLHQMHLQFGAKMTPFAGYEMPLQYKLGVKSEHLYCRSHAGLFDVSHMGQLILKGKNAAAFLETLAPGDFINLMPNQMRYSVFTSNSGGILDDFIVTNFGEYLFLVVNAARKQEDMKHIQSYLPDDIILEHLSNQALLALQGPKAA